MNIDELITEIDSENFESMLDSMTEQELSDYYQRLYDVYHELSKVDLPDLKESNSEHSREDIEKVKANMEKINRAYEIVGKKWAEITNQNNETITLNEINDSMSTSEKIDNIEKQMNTLYYQIAQEKDDITRKKLSDKYFDLSNQLEDLKQQLKEETTIDDDEINDSMSTSEKIDNIEKQMNTLYYQIAQEKDDITRKKLSDKYFDLSNQLEDLKQQLEEEKKEEQETIEDKYYAKQQQLDEYIKIIDEEIKQAELQFEKNNISYTEQYMDVDYTNKVMLREELKKQKESLKHKFENNLLTIEMLNEINTPESLVNENTTQKVDDSSKTDANTDTKNLEDQIEELERKLNENARRLEDAFRKNDKEAEKIARKERKELLEELMNLKKQKSGNMNHTSSGSENGSSRDENNSGNGSDSTDSNNDSNNGNSDGDSSGDSNSDENDNNNENDNDNENDLDPEEPDNEITDEEKKQKRKQKIKKAALGSFGGALGFVLSFVFQPGTAGMVISVGRLVYSAAKKGLKVYTEKHKDDENNKIIKMVGKVKEFTKEQAEHLKITSAISKVNNFLKKPETQVFLNGMAAGYTIGKLSQLVYKMHEASAIEKNIPDNTEVENNSEVGKTQPEFMDKVPDVDTQPDIPTPDPVPEPTFDPTKPVDLSSLGEGYVSSYSSDPVSLITSAGKNAMFDKINVVDGKTWVHFTQGNGAGYAWFPADEVLNALDLSDVSELTGEVSGGMHL
ncbi:MAG: hypothetical protein J6B64_05885 [Bacilli bacterium]|nr:hypothetical protein [Bacilli bacterium]